MIETRDPGELLAFSDACAHRGSREPDTLDRTCLVDARDAVIAAVAALDAILARIPEGQEAVPDHAFSTAAGRAVHDEDPARFQRGYLAARRAHLKTRGYAIRRRLGELADPAFHARTAALADELVQAMRDAPPPVLPTTTLHSLRPVRFAATDDARHPYAAGVDGAGWTVRVNEFPEEPSVYSLLVDGVVVEELMAWPAAWERPGP
jgi:hypothetical protein